jgi:hypothetical protein
VADSASVAAGSVARGALVYLAGMLTALIAVVLVAAVAPRTALSTNFFWASAGASVILQPFLGFAGARLAARRLFHDGPASYVIAAAGPVLIAVLVNLGVATEGNPLAAVLPICGAVIGAALGARRGMALSPGRR